MAQSKPGTRNIRTRGRSLSLKLMNEIIFQVSVQILGYWILNETWKIGATTYTYSIELTFRKFTRKTKTILKLMNGLANLCRTQKWSPHVVYIFGYPNLHAKMTPIPLNGVGQADHRSRRVGIDIQTSVLTNNANNTNGIITV